MGAAMLVAPASRRRWWCTDAGWILSPTRRGSYKGRCDVCSAGVPPAMVVYRCGLVPSPTRRGSYKGRRDVCSAGVPPAMVVYRCGLVPSPTRRGSYKGRCDVCSAGVPPAMVVYRCGLVPSPTRRGSYKGRCDACSAGVPPAMVVYRCGLVPSPTRRGSYKGRRDVCSAGVPPAMVVYRCGLVPANSVPDPEGGDVSRARVRRDGGVPMAGSSLPIRDVKTVGRFRESAGRSGLVGFPAAAPRGSISTGLLGRLWRPSVARSARSRVGRRKGCNHADGAPAACLVAGKADRIALPEGARQRHCAQRDAAPGVRSGTIACPAPRGGRFPRARVGLDFGSTPGWAGIVGAGFQPARQRR